MKEYLFNEKYYYNQYNYLNNIQIKELEYKDYNDYLILMFEFTNYKYNLNEDTYKNYINENKNVKILVLCENNNIIGAGSLFILNKLHNNPVGQIEDVIITEKYRNKGLGKLLMEHLNTIGLNEYKCYKIILNCLDDNEDFYKKCGYKKIGIEMKINK